METLPEEIKPVKIPIIPVGTVEHRSAVDKGFMDKLAAFAKTLGATTSRGGQPGRTLGMYYPGGKRITSKFATPREIPAHETAHFFDDKFGLKQRFYKRNDKRGNTKAVAEELIAHMERMGESANRQGKAEERFADGFEWWLTHRDLAKRDLPLFSGVMADIIREIPALKPVLDIEPSPQISLEREKQTIFGESPFTPKGNIIEYYKGGKKNYMEVSPNLYQALTGMNEQGVGLITKIFSLPAHWLRTGATITPEFILRNPIRDQFTALMQTNFGFVPFLDPAGALMDIFKKTDVYWDWIRSGGAYSGFVELNRETLRKRLDDLIKNPSLLKRLNIITALQDLSQLFEQSTRIGVYKAAKRKGMADIKAGFESREATTDFGRRGSQTKDISSIKAFLNAGIQGGDRTFRAARKDPIGFAIKGLLAITLPTIFLYLKNREDPNYKDIPRWQRDIFWVTKFGDTYVRIPKPFLLGQIFGTIPERALEFLESKDPKAFKGVAKSLWDSLSPVSGDLATGILPEAIKPWIENAVNHNFFMDRPIVSQGREKLLKPEQYGRYTSETAKAVGRAINYSPAKIDNLIQGWFGGMGRYALEASDLIGKGAARVMGGPEAPKRPKELADYPLVKGFVTRPVESQSESINQYYDKKENLDSLYQTQNKLKKEGHGAEAMKILRKYPTLAIAYKVSNKISKEMSDARKKIDAVVANKNLSEIQKRTAIKSFENKLLALGRRGAKILNKF
jgi:hypothetical protein